MKKISKLVTLFIVTSLLFCGCGGSAFLNTWVFNISNREPDDEFSRAVREVIGEDLYYLSREVPTYCGRRYDYLIKKNDVETISGFADALNSSLSYEQGKVCVVVNAEIPDGYGAVFTLSNFSDKTDYDGFYSLEISKYYATFDKFFHDPSIYTVIKGIKRLEISDRMQQSAEESGIDWYAYWPDLEEIIVSEY